MADRDGHDNLEPLTPMESNPTTSFDSTGGLERVIASSPGHDSRALFPDFDEPPAFDGAGTTVRTIAQPSTSANESATYPL